jgi:hypothetical protein
MIHAFRLLARLKFLRGTAFDPFGYTVERNAERKLIALPPRTDETVSRIQCYGISNSELCNSDRQSEFADVLTIHG